MQKSKVIIQNLKFADKSARANNFFFPERLWLQDVPLIKKCSKPFLFGFLGWVCLRVSFLCLGWFCGGVPLFFSDGGIARYSFFLWVVMCDIGLLYLQVFLSRPGRARSTVIFVGVLGRFILLLFADIRWFSSLIYIAFLLGSTGITLIGLFLSVFLAYFRFSSFFLVRRVFFCISLGIR